MANGLDFGTAIGLIKGLGSPDPAVIEGAVNDWLDEHPEATTTVQDGSITKAKLDSNLQGTVDDVADLKSQLNQNNVGGLSISQGYWAIANGTPASSPKWCKTDYFIPTVFRIVSNNVRMFLLAYLGDTYIGTWNGNSFSKTYVSTSYLSYIAIAEWSRRYPEYQFKIDYIKNDEADMTPSECQSALSISAIYDNVQKQKCSNLVGDVFEYLYPIDGLATGTKLTISTSDGSINTATSLKIGFYDEHKTFINYYSFLSNSKRTVKITAELSAAKYISIYDQRPSVPLMINVGEEALPYEVYFQSNTQLTKDVTRLQQGTDDVITIHQQATEELYALRRHFGTSASANNSFKLLWVSDIHDEQNRADRMVKYLNACGNSYFDVALNTGDTVLTLFSQSVQWYDDLVADSDIPILNTVGNHDAWTNLNGDLANKVDVYNKFIAPVAAKTSIVQPTEASTNGLNYYYKDIGGIRLIVLDCMYYDAAEQTWFETVLSDANTNDLPVIACSHAPFAATYCQLIDSIWNVGWFHRDNTLSNIALAGAVKDFEDAGGTFICWLMGHIHGDEVEILPDYNNQLALCTNTFQDRGTTVVKNTNDKAYNYDSFTFVTVDSVNHTVKMYRIGANIDTAGHKHNGFVWDYVNKNLVSEW